MKKTRKKKGKGKMEGERENGRKSEKDVGERKKVLKKRR